MTDRKLGTNCSYVAAANRTPPSAWTKFQRNRSVSGRRSSRNVASSLSLSNS
ncbi:hypothetical protein VB773_01265 [Haloarculaceae archaeon H-GB2-1]|nr:hypothetical protein [Haloarculaceae archaeon H-GB11]MEA5406344.1 hypothetical protein [Haloarculaceae archaeon H-GB2-1]